MQNQIIISFLAGITSVLLLAAGLTGNLLAFPFMALSPLPIAVAAFGWGSKTALFAVLFSALSILFIANIESAAIYALIISLPILYLAHCSGLSRNIGSYQDVEWFPINDIFLRAVLICAVLIGGLLILAQFDSEELTKQALQIFSKDFAKLDTESRQVMEEALRIQIALTPYTMAMVWLLIMWGNLHLAHKIAKKSGQNQRPNISLDRAELPFWIFALPSVGYLLTTLDVPFSHIGATAIGAFFMAFILLGFNCLHILTLKIPMRPILLATAYLLVIIFGLPIFLILGLGIADFFFKIRHRFLLDKS